MKEQESAPGAPEMPGNANSGKRNFLKLMGGASIGLGLGMPALAEAQESIGCGSSGIGGADGRRSAAYLVRINASLAQRAQFECSDAPNGDEESLVANIASFSKGLAHNDLGEVSPSAYQTLVIALRSNTRSLLATVPMGTTPPTRLIAPFQGFAYSLAGPDPQGVPCPPPPTFSSAEAAAEMVECYWLALTRDVPYAAYDSNPMIAAACADLSRQTGYRGPRSASGQVTPANVFRGKFPGELEGPLVSQFLVRAIPHGPYEHEQKLRPFVAGNDFQITYADWLLAQRGGGAGPTPVESTPVFLRNGRDLSAYLLTDYGAQPALEAALILNRVGAPPNASLPPLPTNEAGLIGGFNQFVQLLGGAQGPAIAACFYQKWQVHRRARPDAYSGRVHNHLTGRANYPIPAELLNSAALAASFSRYGNYLLPMAYRVGNPVHPSYPAGHASSVGATVTVLKALYRGDFVLTGNKVASADGLSLLDYAGPLTVEGELNKLAANVALGRDTAGVHYRSDSVEGLLQGERVALAFLAELRETLPASFAGFTLRTFSGVQVTV